MEKIVIVEDNEQIRDAFQTLLSLRPTFNVIATYESCEEAIKNFEQDAPDIVLMDVDLPGISGIEGTKRMIQQRPKTQIIIITVFENGKTVFDALCAGRSPTSSAAHAGSSSAIAHGHE